MDDAEPEEGTEAVDDHILDLACAGGDEKLMDFVGGSVGCGQAPAPDGFLSDPCPSPGGGASGAVDRAPQEDCEERIFRDVRHLADGQDNMVQGDVGD